MTLSQNPAFSRKRKAKEGAKTNMQVSNLGVLCFLASLREKRLLRQPLICYFSL
jgi:hypothetical protein